MLNKKFTENQAHSLKNYSEMVFFIDEKPVNVIT